MKILSAVSHSSSFLATTHLINLLSRLLRIAVQACLSSSEQLSRAVIQHLNFCLSAPAFTSNRSRIPTVPSVLSMFPLYYSLALRWTRCIVLFPFRSSLLWRKPSQRFCFCRPQLSLILHLSVSIHHSSKSLREGYPLRVRTLLIVSEVMSVVLVA